MTKVSEEIIKDTKDLVSGTTYLILKFIKGVFFLSLFLLITRFIEIAYGYTWSKYYSVLILLIIIISIYPLFNKFKKASIFYLIGWLVSLIVFVSFNLIDITKAQLFFIVPILIFIVRLIFFNKSKK